MPILGVIASGITGSKISTSSYESIQTAVGGNTYVEFTSIPATFKHLQIRGIANNGESSGFNNQKMEINGDSTSSYRYHEFYGTGSGTPSAAASNAGTGIDDIFRVPTTSSGYFSAFVIDILDYTSTSKNKTIRCINGGDANGSGWIGLHSGIYFATPAAITSIKFFSSVGNWGSNSSFALYGIKG